VGNQRSGVGKSHRRQKMNTEREVIEKLKSILEEIGVEHTNILLFGSRTGKDFEEKSDWDFLIVINSLVKSVKSGGGK
jgi:predicted nucleotidyltransferase